MGEKDLPETAKGKIEKKKIGKNSPKVLDTRLPTPNK